jgi:hypothetical protein
MSEEIEKVKYGNVKKSIAYFNGRKYIHGEDNSCNPSGTVRWKCANCGGVSFTTKEDTIVRIPNANQKHEVTCLKQLQVSIDCSIEYEYLKHEAKITKNLVLVIC